MSRVTAAVTIVFLPLAAHATTVIVSEPAPLALLALGAAAAVVVGIRRRKK